MNVLKMVATVALVALTAWFVPYLWGHDFRYLATIVAVAVADILALGWWSHVMDLNRSHDAAMTAAVDRSQKK